MVEIGAHLRKLSQK